MLKVENSKLLFANLCARWLALVSFIPIYTPQFSHTLTFASLRSKIVSQYIDQTFSFERCNILKVQKKKNQKKIKYKNSNSNINIGTGVHPL